MGSGKYVKSRGAPFTNKIYFNPSMEKLLHPWWGVGWKGSSILKFQQHKSKGFGMDK